MNEVIFELSLLAVFILLVVALRLVSRWTEEPKFKALSNILDHYLAWIWCFAAALVIIARGFHLPYAGTSTFLDFISLAGVLSFFACCGANRTPNTEFSGRAFKATLLLSVVTFCGAVFFALKSPPDAKRLYTLGLVCLLFVAYFYKQQDKPAPQDPK